MIAQNKVRAAKLRSALEPIAAHSQVKHFRQQGMIFAFDAMPATTEGFARRFFTKALEQELLLRPIGNTVYMMPPFILSDEEIALLAARTLTVLEQTLS